MEDFLYRVLIIYGLEFLRNAFLARCERKSIILTAREVENTI